MAMRLNVAAAVVAKVSFYRLKVDILKLSATTAPTAGCGEASGVSQLAGLV